MDLLRELKIIDAPAESAFDNLTKLSADLFDVPVALISIVDFHGDRQFFKSSYGLSEPWHSCRETPLSHSFCQHVVRTDDALVIGDARIDPDLKDNLAIHDLGLVAYMGVPVYGPIDEPVGALCVIDSKVRNWTEAQVVNLERLANAVTDQIKLRAARRCADKKALEADAANRAKTSFLATMSHEIRTPLNGVIGMASALAVTELTESQSEMLTVISNAGAHLGHLVDDILDLSKIESGGMTLENEVFRGGALLNDVSAMVRGTAEAKALRLLTDISTPVDREFQGDARRIRQVVMNMISNAVKFTDEGSITIRADIEASEADGEALLVISITDTGPGIPDDQKQKIFERYGQGSHTKALERGGAGLGLSISRAICTLHGGDLVVADAVGSGTVFTATFAVQKHRAAVAEAFVLPETVGNADFADVQRLLVAEDNSMNRKVVEALFSAFPVELVFAADGREAFDLLDREDFDAALVDINMPVMSGMECVRAYRTREAGTRSGRLPIIAFSANVMEDQVASYIDAGFDRHLPKPIDLKDVSSCLAWITEKNARLLA